MSDGLPPHVSVHINRTRHRWEDNIKTDIKGICCEDVDWTDFAYDTGNWRRAVITVRNLLVP